MEYQVEKAGAELSAPRIAAQLACTNVLMVFVHLIDENRSLELVDLFAEDGVMEAVPHSFSGRMKIREFLTSRAGGAPTRRTVHAVSNSVFQHVSDREVLCSSVLTVYAYDASQSKANLTPDSICQLDDRFVKDTDGVWRFAHHRRSYIVQGA